PVHPRIENTGAADGTALLERAGNRTLARGTTAGEIGLLSRAQNPSAARPRAPANAWVRRNRHDHLENRSRRNAALSREHESIRLGRKFGRGRELDRSSRYYD